MARITITILCCILPFALGSGGGGHAAASSQSVSDSEDVKILTVDGVAHLSCNRTKEDGSLRHVDWYKEGELQESGDEISIMENGTLTLDPVKEEHVGRYECRATTNEVLRQVAAIIFSYRKMPKSGTAIEGDKLTLTCEAEGVPRPVVSWTKDNVSLVEEMGAERVEFRTNEDNEKTPENATVIISEIKPEDRGNYRCHITSGDITSGDIFIQKDTETYVRVKDIYAALWPFLGILVEVIVLCLIIFIYEKRRTKNDFDESDTDQGNNSKGT